MTKLKKTTHKIKGFAALMAMYGANAMAGLPTKPTAGNQSASGTGYFATIQNYFVDGAVLLSLAISFYAFLRVGQNVLSAYGEIGDGKGTYAQLGGHVAVGIAVLSAVIYLVIQAMAIFGL